jgi:DNA-binding GntR family transcriptional regulator
MSSGLSRLGELVVAAGYRTLADKAFSALHDAILRGDLQPGQRLTIEDLAGLLGMSPMPIREAVRRLDGVGLVENVPHRGARVTELSVEDLRDVYDVRLALEPLAIRRAAERLTDADAALAVERFEALDALADSDSTDSWAAHTAFHFALYEPARSKWLVRLIRPLWESSERYRMASPIRRTLSARRDEHRRILEALLDRDPDAAALALHAHLTTTATVVARALGVDELFEQGEGAPRVS